MIWNRDYSFPLEEEVLAHLLIFVAALGRIIPHPFNATPVGAMALVGGAKLGPVARWVTPFTALVISDVFLNAVFYGFQREWWSVVPFTYGSFALNILLGMVFAKKPSWGLLALFSILGSVQFFILSNFGTWLTSGLYPKTTAGLVECFILALPFFKNTLLGDFAWCFGLYWTLEKVSRTVPAASNKQMA